MIVKKIFLVCLSVLFFSSCSLAIRSLLGLKNPVVETKETINNFISESNFEVRNNFILKVTNPDSTAVINNILKSLSSDFLLFDSQGVRYCYNKDETCTGIVLENALMDMENNFEPCPEDSLNYHDILSNLDPVNSESSLTNDSVEYQMIYYWSKFIGGKKRFKEERKWLLELERDSPYNIDILFVNTDLQADWGLEQGKKMKVKIKFLDNKSASIDFGEIPYKN